MAGTSIIIELDANSKLGKAYNENDPHDIFPNGILLADILKRHNLTLGNGNKKCKGIITRKK